MKIVAFAAVGAVLTVLVGFVIHDTVSAGRVAAPAPVVTPPSPPVGSLPLRPQAQAPRRSRAGAIAKNRAFVAEMLSNQAGWAVGYQASYSPTISRFDDLVMTLDQGMRLWSVLHLVFRWQGDHWMEVANIPATPIGRSVTNGMLERFEPFVS